MAIFLSKWPGIFLIIDFTMAIKVLLIRYQAVSLQFDVLLL
jgi:hypothetical protein